MSIQRINNGSGAAVGYVIATVLLVAAGVVAKVAIQAPAIDADRAAERYKALAELTVAEDKALNTPAVLDSQRGIVRLPIETALQVAAEKWPTAAAARADLAARLEKATAVVKPVSFE